MVFPDSDLFLAGLLLLMKHQTLEHHVLGVMAHSELIG
jgi:hypothetical protein